MSSEGASSEAASPSAFCCFGSDVLANITSSIDGHSIGALWMVGNKILNQKLAHGGVMNFTIVYGTSKRTLEVRWPTLVSEFRQLRIFRAIWDRELDKTRKFCMKDLEKLPSSIESIEVYITRRSSEHLGPPDMFVPLYDLEYGKEGSNTSKTKTSEAGKVFAPGTFSPLLRSIGSTCAAPSSAPTMSSPAPAAPKKFSFSFDHNAVPSTANKKPVVTNRVVKPMSGPTANKHFRSLTIGPDSDVKVSLSETTISHILSSTSADASLQRTHWAPNKEKLPNLKKVVVPSLKETFDTPASLPDSLETVYIHCETLFLQKLPSSITSLNILVVSAHLDLSRFALLSKLTIRGSTEFDPTDISYLLNLESLECGSVKSLQSLSKYLPSTLTSLVFSWPYVTEEFLKTLPKDLKCLEVAVDALSPDMIIALPRNLTLLTFKGSSIPGEHFELLPSSLTSISSSMIFDSYDDAKAAFLHLPNLRELDLQDSSIPSSPSILPLKLEILRRCTLGNVALGLGNHLMLKSIQICAAISEKVQLTASDFPPNLRHLELHTVNFISPVTFPKCLTSLITSFNRAIDYPEDWMSLLPTSVTSLHLHAPAYSDFLRIPAQIRHLRIEGTLEYFKMQDFKALPRGLISLSVKWISSAEIRARFLADLPPALERAYFATPSKTFLSGPSATRYYPKNLGIVIWDKP